MSVILITVVLGVVFAQNVKAYEFEFGKGFSIDIHGFLSQGYLKSNHNNFLAETEEGTFEFREYGLNVSSYLTDQLRVGAQLFGRDFGDYGDNKPILDWAFADFHFRDWLGIRAGRMKFIHGLYNETRDIDMVRTHMFLPESIYNDAWRDSFTALNGVSLYGTLPLWSLGSVSYQAQWGEIKIEPDGGFEDYLNKFIPRNVNDVETSHIYVAGIELNPAPPLDGLRLKWAWNTWEMDDEGTSTSDPFWVAQGIPPDLSFSFHAELDLIVLSAEYRWGDLVVSAETFAPAGYEFRLDSPLLGTVDERTDDPAGYYAGIAYRFTDWLELGILYSAWYNNETDKDGREYEANNAPLAAVSEIEYPRSNAWLKDTTLTARFDIRENWVVKIEGHIMDGTDIMLSEDNPDGMERNWFLFGGKVTYNF